MKLTPREINVIRKLAEGLTVKEVAAALFVAPSTIVTHKKHIYEKMQARSLVQLGVLAARNGILVLILLATCSGWTTLSAQTVPDLTSDIPPSNGFATMADVEATFNNARRQEEIQLGLPSGTMADLVLPDPAFWNNLTDEQQMLFLINDERSSRNGIDYQADALRQGLGKRLIPVCLLPFEGIFFALDLIAQGQANYLLENNLFTHTDGNGNEPIDRFNLDQAIAGFFTALIVIESIAALASTDLSSLDEAHIDAIYSFIYVDLLLFFKHREMLLVAKQDMAGYLNDDYGEMGKEGVLGIGIAEGPYNGLPFGKVFVLDLIDLIAGAPGEFLTDSDVINRTNCPDQSYISGQIQPPLDGSFQTSGTLQTDTYIMDNSDVQTSCQFCEFMPGFEVQNGSAFSAQTGGCNN